MAQKHKTKVGRYTVIDEGVWGLVCADCGAPDVDLQTLGVIERRAARVALQDLKVIDGEVLRFARKALGLRQQDLADLLDKSPQTVSRWETGAEPIGRAVQLAVADVLGTVQRNGLEVLEKLVHPEGPDSGDRLYVKTA